MNKQTESHLEIMELKQLVHELFNQVCTTANKMNPYMHDHMCISIYEHTQQKLIDWGMIKASDCARE